MDVSLTPEALQFIQSQLETGEYASADEVIMAGIELLEERKRIYKGRFEELRKEITIGLEASERGEVIDGEALFAELEEDIREIEMEMQRSSEAKA